MKLRTYYLKAVYVHFRKLENADYKKIEKKVPHSYHSNITVAYSSVYVFSLVILNMIFRINCLLGLVFLTLIDSTAFGGSLPKNKYVSGSYSL